MNINRNINRAKVNKVDKIPLTFDIRVLNLFCSFVISENKYIRKHHLMNLRKVLDIIDPSTYENDIDKVNRIRFINKALEAKLDRRLVKKDMIIILNLIEKLQKENKKYKQFFDLMLRLDSDYFMNCGDEGTIKLVDEIEKLESE